MTDLTANQVRALLRTHIAHCYGSQAEAARRWGLSTAFVSAVLSGVKSPNSVMLAELGLERVVLVTYRSKDT